MNPLGKRFTLNSTSEVIDEAVEKLTELGFIGFGLEEDANCIVVWDDCEFTTVSEHEWDHKDDIETLTNLKDFINAVKKEFIPLEVNLTHQEEKEMLEVKIKKLYEDAVIPKYETTGSVGMDLTAVSKSYDGDNNVVYGTGLAIEIPEGYYADLRPRSSISKYDLMLANSVGTIDSDYRGELILKFKRTPDLYQCEDGDARFSSKGRKHYEVGDRIAQLIILPYPKIKFVEVNDLGDSDRGEGGFGSTGS